MSALAPALDRLDRIPLSAAQKKRLQIHPASILILLLAFAAWVIALGGVGGSTSNCLKGYTNTATGNHTPLDCTFLYQWDWWTLWFEGCLLISLFVSIFFESFNKGKSAMIIFLTLATNCLMTSCNRFITLIPSLGLTTTHEQKIATNAGAAGYTMLALFNFCLLIILGFEPNKAPEGVQNKFEPLEEIPMGAV